MAMQTGLASVTPLGIIYRGKKYTCSRAIKEQWFYRSWLSGTWFLSVQSKETDLDTLIVSITKEEYFVLYQVNLQHVDQYQLIKYFNLIDIFKESKKRIDRRQKLLYTKKKNKRY
jgi:hypothetical protein